MASSSAPIFTGPGKVDSYTSTIYGLIRDQKYGEAIRLLTVELQNFPRSRAALSLLGYCYYALQDFRNAAQIYEELCRQYPEVDSYRVYHAQCLYKAGLHPEASRACARVDSEQYAQRLLQLQAAIKYEEDDLAASRALLDKCVADDPETMVNQACVVYKEGQFEEARQLFTEALHAAPYNPGTAYAVALCHYKLKQYGPALQLLNDIIERGVREHPELSVGSASLDGPQSSVARSVGNSATLRETALVEAFNLKAAISMQIGELDKAREALADMPPRLEEELDPVTLHNIALTHIDVNNGSNGANGGAGDAAGGTDNIFDGAGSAGSHGLAGAFAKLNFLLANPPFPSEAFANLLLLYVKHGYHDLAADVMAENAHLTVRYLTTDMYDFLDASLLAQTSPAEAYRRLDALTGVHVEALRRYTKSIQDSRLSGDAEGVKRALKLYDEQLEKYIPVLLSMSKIYWDRRNYTQVEKILRQASEFASEHEAWQLAVGHCYFMQEGRAADCIRYYEPIVQKFMAGAGEMGSPASVFGSGGGMGSGAAPRTGGLLDVQPIVLANLCVAYVITGQNESAEQIIHAIEREEERMKLQQEAERGGRGGSSGRSSAGPVGSRSKVHHYFHSCIVNLAIGTLYCSKGRFDFGITRVLASLEDMPAKLGLDTWHYAKRALLALAEGLSKGLVAVEGAARFSYPAREGKADGLIPNVIKFLLAAEEHGRKIQVMFAPPSAAPVSGPGTEEGGIGQDTAVAAAAQAAAAAALEAAKHTVSYEARLLRLLFLKLNEE